METKSHNQKKYPDLAIELAPGISLIDVNPQIQQDSNVLVTIVQNGFASTHHFLNGIVKELVPEHLLESIEAEQLEKNIKKSARIMSKSFLVIGYGIALLLFAFSLFSFTGVVKARVVLTGSMSPAIRTGDVIVTTPLKYKNPVVGDVIAYQAKRFNGSNVGVFSHRIIGGDMYSGYIVKGDSNKLPDSQRPTGKDILGVVILVIPFIGNLLTPKALFLLVPTFFGFYLIVDAMRSVE
jgi:signal peptidase I